MVGWNLGNLVGIHCRSSWEKVFGAGYGVEDSKFKGKSVSVWDICNDEWEWSRPSLSLFSNASFKDSNIGNSRNCILSELFYDVYC